MKRVVLLCLVAAALPATAEDKSGVHPSRLKLPSGPGSIEGIGENAEPNLSMGLMTYGVPIVLPPGYEGATPSLRLSYSSGAGNSPVGLGWSIGMPTVERMTARGLPNYGPTDLIAANGSDELVEVARGPDSATFRARFEGGFVRYTWYDLTGLAGYWTAEWPDGRIGWFGATSDGAPVDAATVRSPEGHIFCWQLVETKELLGHRVRYEYTRDPGGASLLSRVSYAFTGPRPGEGPPRFEVSLEYEDRPDPLSDGKPGFEVRTEKRLRLVTVLANGAQLRSYTLDYKGPDGDSTGLSRLASVTQRGLAGSDPYPILFRFSYSGGLGPSCAGGMCNQPKLVTMGGATGVDLRAGSADLVDLNGDGLPDLLDTAMGSAEHRIFDNRLHADGTHEFSSTPRSAHAGSLNLRSGSVQLFDFDGDGDSDLIDAASGILLENRSDGDWQPARVLSNLGLPDLSTDLAARLVDLDGDRAPDILKLDGSAAQFCRNLGDGHFDQCKTVSGLPDAPGLSFAQSGAYLADMNGDGVVDVVRIGAGLVQYWMNLGHGRFAPSIELSNAPASLTADAHLVDINGDGLADLVTVRGTDLVYALNQNGRTFAAQKRIGAPELALPETVTQDLVRFADMNGNGSTDVVWFDGSGRATYLELFRRRPNLLTRIENGIGKVIEVEYGSAAEHLAAVSDTPQAWTHRMPVPVLSVDAIHFWDTASMIRQTQRFVYADGYYDGAEKQFRGFESVHVETPGDDTVEAGLTKYAFDVGRGDLYRKALMTSSEVFSALRPIRAEANSYQDCHVAEIPTSGLRLPIRFICLTSVVRRIQEGADPSKWPQTREEYGYDGYGNRTSTAKRGVVSIGGSGCPSCDRDPDSFGAPCGAQCLGDEAFESVDFVSPTGAGGRWVLRKEARKRTSGVETGGRSTEVITHYDGADFVGLPMGELTQGLVGRIESGVTTDRLIDTQRMRYDARGAVVELKDANDHRRKFKYDDASLLLEAEEIPFDDPGHGPYSLRMRAEYEPVQQTVSLSTDWILVRDDSEASTPHETRYTYDSYGRLASIVRPGDTIAAPSERFEYQLSDPLSRIIRQRRTKGGAPTDLEEVTCLDGLGRKLQTKVRVEERRWQVSGFSGFNLRGLETQKFQPYVTSGSDCDLSPPDTVLGDKLTYDSIGRVLRVTRPDESIYGTASFQETRYEPLQTVALDEEDTDPTSKHAGTPLVSVVDGLDRAISAVRFLAPDHPVPIDFLYDDLGHLRGWRDVKGNQKKQTYDLLGRITHIDDPDSGRTTIEYDDAGNVVRQTDARGITVRRAYDEASRMVAEWDEAHDAETRIAYTFDIAQPTCAPTTCTNPEGRVAQVTYPEPSGTHGEDVTGYDERGRATYMRRTIEGRAFELGTTYDNADRVIASSYPGGQSLSYVLDGASRVTAIPGLVSGVTYDGRGQAAQMQHANGVITTSVFDAQLRLASLDVGSAADLIIGYDYSRDRVGNIHTVTDRSARSNEPSAAAEYDYDAWYRLTQARLDAGRGEQAENLTYGFDELDNITLKTSDRGDRSPEHVGDYSYGGGDAGAHAVTRAGALTFAYDAAGNTRERGDQELTWDFLGRLTRVTRSGEALFESTYGPSSQRITKDEPGGEHVIYLSPDYEIRDGVGRLYARVGGVRVAVTEAFVDLGYDLPSLDGAASDGKVSAGDAWVALRHPQGVMLQVGRIVGAAALASLPLETRCLHTEQRGDLSAVTRPAGDVDERHQNYPWGSSRSASAGSIESRLFTGHERDHATQLVYASARYLDTARGLWRSPDPAAQFLRNAGPSSAELVAAYSYVMGRPTSMSDPTGLLTAPAESNQVQADMDELGTFMGPANDYSEQKIAEAGNSVSFRLDAKWTPATFSFEGIGGAELKVSSSGASITSEVPLGTILSVVKLSAIVSPDEAGFKASLKSPQIGGSFLGAHIKAVGRDDGVHVVGAAGATVVIPAAGTLTGEASVDVNVSQGGRALAEAGGGPIARYLDGVINKMIFGSPWGPSGTSSPFGR